MDLVTIPAALGQRLMELTEELAPYLDPERQEPIHLARQGDWTAGMVQRFRVKVGSLPGATSLLELAASRPDEEVSYPDVLESAHLDDRSMRVQLAAMSKLSRQLFGRVTWPINAWQGSDGIMRYSMPSGVAYWWRGHESTSHVGKYRPLWAWLKGQERDEVRMSFSEIEEILGFPLPPSSRKHTPHWHSYEGSAVVRAIQDAGWKAKRVSLRDEAVTLERQS